MFSELSLVSFLMALNGATAMGGKGVVGTKLRENHHAREDYPPKSG
jgi:hypothetical protein